MVPIEAAFKYPVVVAWTWGQGWLTKLGFIDFAGSAIVYLSGSITGLTISILMKPRKRKFE